MKFFKKTMLAIVAMGALAACSDSQNGGNDNSWNSVLSCFFVEKFVVVVAANREG